jgi:hypothetical protein
VPSLRSVVRFSQSKSDPWLGLGARERLFLAPITATDWSSDASCLTM